MAKRVVLGITGSIAAYKAADIVSRLKKLNVEVKVILTKAGSRFITPITLETLSKNPVVEDMFSRSAPWEVEHISLAKWADLFLVAPASANFLAKAANGIADDMLSTVFLAADCKKMIAPAMNKNMYLNAATQRNISTLIERGCKFIQPESGKLACDDEGIGRLASVDSIVVQVMDALKAKSDFSGIKIVVTAGPTKEKIDPVRYITNRSSGKMGFALAEAAFARGADVTLISGVSQTKVSDGIRVVEVVSSSDMFDAVTGAVKSAEVLIMAAAPADFTPITVSEQKIKKNGKEGLSVELKPTVDILKAVGQNKGDKILVGFAAETENLEQNAKAKLDKKNLDIIACNDVSGSKTGFGSDDNEVRIYKKDGSSKASGLMKKTEIADWLLDEVSELLKSR